MQDTPFGPWPKFSQEEIDTVSQILQSGKVNYWTGDECRKFEKEFAEFAETNHAIALSNGTLALDLALHGLGIGSHNGGSADDEVIVTPRSFIASVSCVINAGAIPVFADIDFETQNLSPASVSPHLTNNTRAIICVHLAGWPCDMDGFHELINGTDIKLIEDCAQAHGAIYKGRPVGGLGHVGAWSFCQEKIITTGGEGGMITCNDETLWRKMWAYKDHGKSYASIYERDHPPGFRWHHESFGTNWRMLEYQGAIGRIQLRKLSEWNSTRTQNAQALTNAFSKWAGPDGFLRIPNLTYEDSASGKTSNSVSRHAWYKYNLFVRPENLPEGWTRDKIMQTLNDQGLPCLQGSCSEIYLEKAFDNSEFRPKERLPVAKALGETSIMFMVHPGVTPIEIDLDMVR